MSEILLNDWNSALNVSQYVLCGDTTSFQSYSNQIASLSNQDVSLSNDIVTLTNTVNNISSGMNTSYSNFGKSTGDGSGNATYGHSLGRIPKWIEFVSATSSTVIGYYDVINNTNYSYGDSTYSVFVGSGVSGFYSQRGYVTGATSTNFTINWQRNGTNSPVTGYVIFKVIG
jgi:hypothetical protein